MEKILSDGAFSIKIIWVQLSLSKPNCLGTNCVRFIQVKLTKISYIGTLFNVRFIQDFDVFRVQFIQDFDVFRVQFIQDFGVFRVQFRQDFGVFRVQFIQDFDVFSVQFIQDFGVFRVQFIQDFGVFRVQFIQDFGVFRVQFRQDFGIFRVQFRQVSLYISFVFLLFYRTDIGRLSSYSFPLSTCCICIMLRFA